MRAAVSKRYGAPEVVEIRQVPTPSPGPGEVLVRVHAATVSRSDCGMRRAHPFFIRLATGLWRPKRTILGLDFAGTVEATDPDVTAFGTGDRIFGLSPDAFGAHAEYLCVPDDGPLAAMPTGMDFEEAVICAGAWYAEIYLQRFGIQSGDKILIYGASGAIGTAAVQLAKARSAQVTAVVGSRHVELAVTLGADRVIDYRTEDFTRIDETFDFVLDAVGKTTYSRCRRLLKPGGTFAATDLGPWGQNILLAAWSTLTGTNRVVFPLPKANRQLVARLKKHMEAGELRGVFDRTYPLEEIVEAYRYVETEQKTGIVVLRVVAPGDFGS